MFFLLVDAHSKLPEIFCMSSTSCTKIIKTLKHVFSSYGLPNQLVTEVADNGSQFTSQEIACFCQDNSIHHTRALPYHPSYNEAIEHLRKKKDQFLIVYPISWSCRSTPHATTGLTSSELFLTCDL